MLLPWNVTMNEFDYLNERTHSKDPTNDYALAVNGMLTVTQLFMLFQGHRLSDRFKL